MFKIFIGRIIASSAKDIIFCITVLFLCFSPSVNLDSQWQIAIIFVSFILWLLGLKILQYKDLGGVFAIFEYDKTVKQKEKFVATLSHDLKTPVISQITTLEMILNENFGSLNDTQKSMIECTLNSCKYVKEMVFTLLETYKYKSGTVVLKYENFNINNLVNECINEVKTIARERNINFEIFSDTRGDNSICADKMQIKRVIMNLISNALKYSYRDNFIKISFIKSKGFLRFYIENSGPIIPDSVLKQLFKEYTSFSQKTAKGGTGLGLYVSKKIIEAHNGNIKAESSPDNKNIFSFYIPSIIFKEHKNAQNSKKLTF